MNLAKADWRCTAGFYTGRLPAIERIEGRYTVIERLSKENMEQIFIRSTGRTLQQLWTFLFKGPAP